MPTYLGRNIRSELDTLVFANTSQDDLDALDWEQQSLDDIARITPARAFSTPDAPVYEAPGQIALTGPRRPVQPEQPPDWRPLNAQIAEQARQMNRQVAGDQEAPGADPTSLSSGPAAARPQPVSGVPSAMPTGGSPSPVGDIDNSSRESFVRTAYPHALQAADGDPRLAQQLIATAISENGKVGTGQSLGDMGFNVGGIQGVKGTAGSFTALDAGRPREFAAYNTLGEGFRAVRDLVSGGRYAQAAANYQQTGDIDRYWKEVNEAGYSETPDWQDRIASIRRSQVEPITAGLSASDDRLTTRHFVVTSSSPQPSQNQGESGWEVDQAALDDPDKWSLCGPVAAVMAATRRGGQWTVAQAKKIAVESGLWNADQGMGGLQTEVSLLNKLGVAAKTGAADLQHLTDDALAGNTPIISTVRHYFILKGYDPETGKFDTTTSGSVLKGGSRWLTLDQIEKLGGGIQGAAYIDNPSSPISSAGVGSAAAPDAYKLSDTLPADEPTLSPGDQKRARLAAVSGQPLTGNDQPQPYDNGPDVLPGADSPSVVPGGNYRADPIRTAEPPGPGQSNPYSPGDDAMYRQPLNSNMGPDTATGQEYDPRDADQGAHEWQPTSETQSDPSQSSSTTPSPSAMSPSAASTAPYEGLPSTTPSVSSADDPGAAQDAYSAPPEIPSKPGYTPILDAAHRVIAWIQDTASTVRQSAASIDQVNASPTLGAGQDLSDPLGPGAGLDQRYTVSSPVTRALNTPITAPAPQNPEIAPDAPPMPSEMTMARRERIRQGGQLTQDETDAILARRAEHTTLSPQDEARALPYQVAEATRSTIMDAAQSFANAIRAGQEGRPLAAAGNALWAAIQATPQMAGFSIAQRTIDEMIPEARIAGVGPGAIVGLESLIGDGIKGINGLKNAPGRLLSPESMARADEAVSGAAGAVRSGAESVGRGIRGALDANAERMAAADARAAEAGSVVASAMIGATPGTQRLYHGTAEAFPRPDPGKFDPQGLYGPGYYLTDNPEIASSYADARNVTPGGITPKATLRANRLNDELAQAKRDVTKMTPDDPYRQHLEQRIQEIPSEIDRMTSQGPNVRAVDVPEDLRLIDLTQPLREQSDLVNTVYDAISDPVAARRFDGAMRSQAASGKALTGDDLWQALESAYGDGRLPTRDQFARLHADMQSAGIDGLSHQGGQIRPLLNAQGQPIEHQVTVVFPGSLDKLRNGFSGEVGGATLGVVPSSRGAGALNAVTREAGRVVAGGVGGATLGAGAPADTPEERSRNALIGAGVGMVAGPLASRAIRSEGGALATFGASPNYRPPTPQQVQQAAKIGARRGQALNEAVVKPASAVPGRVAAATRATDDRAALRWAEDMLTDTAGSPRLRENDPARPSTQSRVNAGSVATERIANDLEPAIMDAATAGLQNDLPRFLEDTHHRDVLDEFYTRGKQAVLDDRAQKIAAAQANGASPAVIARMQAKAAMDAEAAGTRAMRQRQGTNAEHAYEATDARLQEQEQRLTADGRWQQLQDAAQAIWDHNTETRQRLVDSGNLDPQVAADLAAKYPHYVPTVPISHLTEGGGPVASSGTAVSRGTKPSISALEDVGTSGERLNPIVASRNSTVKAEREIQRNNVATAFAQMMDDALRADPKTMATSPATHRTFLGGGTDVHYFENGERKTISVPKVVADGLEAAANMGADPNAAGRIWRSVMGTVTSAMTAGRASFLPVNLLRDVQDYATRTATKEGGPQKIPGVMGAWMSEAGKAAADIARAQLTGRGYVGAATGFAAGAAVGDDQTTIGERLRHGVEGAVAGTFIGGANKVRATGKAAEYLARGGGSGGVSAHWIPGQRWYREVLRDGGAPIKSVGDATKYLGDWLQDVATLQGVKGINERTELISRTAAMTRADKQGIAPAEAMIRGRDASYDPDRSGTVARMLNGWVPFFNASVQNSAQFVRLFKQNPVAATATIAATTAPIMLGLEAWNRSDPTRAQVYDDIPQYVKDSGLVAVLPWAGSDNRGERPNYLWIPTGVQTPFIMAMRGAMENLPGLEPTAGRGSEDWADKLGAVLGMFSPVRGDSIGAAMSNLVPQGIKQGVELAVNRDFYRGNPIETGPADERASAASQAVSGGANAVGRAVGNDWLQEVRPSGVEHVMRSLPAYSDIVTGASDMVKPSGYKQAEDRPIQNEPFVGGIASRFIRDTGGANLQRAQDDKLPESVRAIFEEAGLRPSDMGTVPGSYKQAPLTREEQQRWQAMTNTLMAREVAAVRRSPAWRERGADKEQLVREAMAKAREDAAARALSRLDEREIERRKRTDAVRKAG